MILLGAVIGFAVAFASSSYFLAVLFIIGGLLTWMVYLNIARVRMDRPTGAILIIFGVLLASAIFMAFGIEQDMWGGFRLKAEGALLSLIILFFAVMPGLVFYYFHKPVTPQTAVPDRMPTEKSPLLETTRPPEPPPPTGEMYDYGYPEWTEEDYEYYDPEAWAAYYEGEEYEEEEEEEDD